MDEGQKSSPHADQESREPVTKVKRTYGRKREATDASIVTDPTITFPQTRLEPSEVVGRLESGESLSNDASDTFGWKEKLALIDKQFDEEDLEVPNRPTRKIADELFDKDSSFARSPSTEDDSSGLRDEALFSASIPPLSSQSDPPSPGSSEPKFTNGKLFQRFSESAEAGELVDGSSPTEMAAQNRPAKGSQAGIGRTPSLPDYEHGHVHEGKPISSPTHKDCGVINEMGGMKQREIDRKGGSSKKKEQSNKIKKLSKKEEKESKKAHARMMADQKVSLTKRAELYTVEHLLKSVQQRQLLSETKLCVASSDPIQEFTSSPNTVDATTEMEPKAEPSRDQYASDDDMLDVRQTTGVDNETKQAEEAQRKNRLAAAKRRVLETSRTLASAFSSDDDDLEIVADVKVTAAEPPKSSSSLEKRLAGVAGFRMGSSRHSLSQVFESSQGDAALKVAAIPVFTHRDTRRPRAALDHRDLQTVMLSKATKQSMQLTKEKEEEWKRRGGKLIGKQRATLSSEPLSLDHLAEDLALKRRHDDGKDRGEDTGRTDSDLEDDDDGEWQPERYGSMSPSSHRSVRHSDEEEAGDSTFKMEDTTTLSEEVTAPDDQVEATEDEDLNRPSHHARRINNLLVISDSESEETQQQGRGRILVPETSLIVGGIGQGSEPSSECGLDEENKENNVPPAIDSGDDKENTVPVERVPSFRPLFRSRLRSGAFSPEDIGRHLPLSPAADEDDGMQSVRRPLQVRRMSDLDDLFVLRSPPSVTSPKTPKSRGSHSARSSPASLRPAFDGSAGGFTQLFNDGEGVCMDAPSTGALQPAFRLRVNKEPPRSVRPNSGSVSPETKKQPRKFVYNDELSLTLDTKLQPALEVTTQVRRRADAVFEKEQDFVMKEASLSPTSSRSKQELYVSENGLLTQTRPEGSTPLVYRSWTPSRVQAGAFPPSTTKRLPLSTLSLDGETISPSQQRLTRLIKGKGRADSFVDDIQRSPLPMDQSSNAFSRMLEAARKQKRTEKKLGKSNFVEGEAVESDEDEMFGFGQLAREDDEESDEDHPDAVVENLIDDAAMDAQAIAEEKVLEKVKEHLEEDDAALEKYHQAAIEGKFRGKRRGGLAVDDSESDEDEDDEARRLRRRMHKKRRIQGDKLEDLKKDEKSRVFYEAYQRDIQEEDTDDFSHLANDEMNEDENDGDEEPETVSATDVREQLREIARQNKSGLNQLQVFDPEDVTWADALASSDDELRVKEVDDRPKRMAVRRPVFGRADVPELDDALPRKPTKLSDEQAAQLAAWRKEQSGRNVGTGGMRGAITGHGPKAPRHNNGLRLKSASSRQDNSKQPVRRKVTKMSSVLASVSDRHSRFAP